MPEKVVGKNGDTEKKVPELQIIPLEKLADILKEQKMYDILVEKEEKNLLYYHYRDREDIYFLFNTSLSETVQTDILLPEHTELIRWDAWKNIYSSVEQTESTEGMKISLKLAPYESVILMTNHEKRETEPEKILPKQDEMVDISDGWTLQKARSAEYPNFSDMVKMDTLVPVSASDPEFSGIMRYENTVELPVDGRRVIFAPQYIYEVAEVFVNGRSAGKQITPSYEWDITEFCVPGKNQIVVEVANTPTRDTLKNPGIFGPVREILEPSGMFGNIVIKLY